MTQTDAKSDSASGKAFFDRADEVAETGNWDFAIEMYLEGIAREPDNIARGHQPLREVSLKRKVQGGKGPGLMEQLKRRGSKDPLGSLLDAEYLLAKEPGSTAFMERVLKSARALSLPELIKWIAAIMLDAQRQAPKRSSRILILLSETYSDIEEFAPAIQACEMALEFKPDDQILQEKLGELSAKYTIKKGKYDEKGDFTRSIKDFKKQKELIQQDTMVKDREFLIQRIDDARREYQESPTVTGKINALVDALLKPEEPDREKEAIDVLAKAQKETGAYQFKMRIGEIRIRQMTRRYNELLASGDEEAAAEQASEQLKFELQEYADRAANYPTDLSIKYELGRRQYLVGSFDEAIASLQQAQRDPRRRLMAMNYLGQAFARKRWFREAAETYERALEGEMPEQRAKELRYNLGDAFEHMGELAKAQDQFSEVAQIDFNYKDVRRRVEAVRRKIEEGSAGA